jgi:hypothetical protein
MDGVALVTAAAIGLSLALWPIPTMESLAACMFVCPRSRAALLRHVAEHKELLRGVQPPTRLGAGTRPKLDPDAAAQDAGVPLRRVLEEVASRMQVRLVAGAVLANLALQVCSVNKFCVGGSCCSCRSSQCNFPSTHLPCNAPPPPLPSR